MGAPRTVPMARCALGHVSVQLHARAERDSKRGTTRTYRCRYLGDDGLLYEHHFTVLVKSVDSTPEEATRALIDDAVPVPPCPTDGHDVGRVVVLFGTYDTAAGSQQRYQCRPVGKHTAKQRHTFSAVLPRSAVTDETCCGDCAVPTPRNAGTEAPSRRLPIPASVVYAVLHDLAEGRAYTRASIRALERMGRPTGRVRTVDGRTPDQLNDDRPPSPDREMKAHWHLSADILERFGPIVTEPALAKIAAEEADFRKRKLPVVYLADEVPVVRDYARSTTLTNATVVWHALVISGLRWNGTSRSTVTGWSSRLVRFRALPNATAEAWQLVLSELEAPDYLVADGASQISAAAKAVWGEQTRIVPCIYHAAENLRAKLTGEDGTLPDKVRDHLFDLSRATLAAKGAPAATAWFEDLETIASACGLPADVVRALRQRYEPLLERSAEVAHSRKKPRVPISNTGVEGQIREWVSGVTERRGPMFANIGRTNLLADLVVAASNGALLNQHEVVQVIRNASRDQGGWSPPPRALTEAAGAMSLRDAYSIEALLEQAQ